MHLPLVCPSSIFSDALIREWVFSSTFANINYDAIRNIYDILLGSDILPDSSTRPYELRRLQTWLYYKRWKREAFDHHYYLWKAPSTANKRKISRLFTNHKKIISFLFERWTLNDETSNSDRLHLAGDYLLSEETMSTEQKSYSAIPRAEAVTATQVNSCSDKDRILSKNTLLFEWIRFFCVLMIHFLWMCSRTFCLLSAIPTLDGWGNCPRNLKGGVYFRCNIPRSCIPRDCGKCSIAYTIY